MNDQNATTPSNSQEPRTPPPIGAPPIDLPPLPGSAPAAPAAPVQNDTEEVPPTPVTQEQPSESLPPAYDPAAVPLIPDDTGFTAPAQEAPAVEPATPSQPPPPPQAAIGPGRPFDNDPYANVEILGSLAFPMPTTADAEEPPLPEATADEAPAPATAITGESLEPPAVPLPPPAPELEPELESSSLPEPEAAPVEPSLTPAPPPIGAPPVDLPLPIPPEASSGEPTPVPLPPPAAGSPEPVMIPAEPPPLPGPTPEAAPPEPVTPQPLPPPPDQLLPRPIASELPPPNPASPPPPDQVLPRPVAPETPAVPMAPLPKEALPFPKVAEPSPPLPVAPSPQPQATPESNPELAQMTTHLESVADMLTDDGFALPGSPPQMAPPLSGAPGLPPTQPGLPRAAPTAAIPTPMGGVSIDTTPAAHPGENRGMLFLLACIFGLGALAMMSGRRTGIWLSLLGLNVVGTVGFNLMLRRLPWAHKDDWFTAAILQTGLMLPFLAKEAVRPITFPHHYVPFDYFLLAVAVTCLISLQFCNVRALKNLEASVYSVVFNARILFATVFGTLLLKEPNQWLSLLGGLLIFAAIFLIRQKGVKAVTMQGVLFALGAALSMSLMNTCEKDLIMRVGYEQYIFPMFTIAAVIMWGIVLLRPHKIQIPFSLIFKPQSLLLMALRACAGIGFSYSLVFGPVAVSSYISSLSVVLLVVFGMLFLGEWDYLKSKLLATSTALAGLTLILMDSII